MQVKGGETCETGHSCKCGYYWKEGWLRLYIANDYKGSSPNKGDWMLHYKLRERTTICKRVLPQYATFKSKKVLWIYISCRDCQLVIPVKKHGCWKS